MANHLSDPSPMGAEANAGAAHPHLEALFPDIAPRYHVNADGRKVQAQTIQASNGFKFNNKQ